MLINIILYLLIISIFFVTCSLCEDNETSEPTELDNPGLVKQYYTTNTIIQKPGDISIPPSTPVLSFDSNGGGNFMSVSYSSSPGDRVRIRKFTSPVNKSGYLLNDGLLISVEILCKDDNVDEVEVSEIIDDELYVVNKTIYSRKLDNISEIREYKKQLLENPFGCYAENCLLRCDINNSEWDENIDTRKIFLGKIFLHEYNETNNECTYNISEETSIKDLLNNLSNRFDIYYAEELDRIRFCNGTNSYNISIFNETDSMYINFSINEKNNIGLMKFSDGREYNVGIIRNKNFFEAYDLIQNFDFDISHINTDELFVYKYEIKPKKRGIFYIDTLAKTYARPYIEYPMILDINAKPKFEIYPLLSKKEVLEGDKVDLVYVIKYLGGSSKYSISNINVKLDQNPQFYSIDLMDNKLLNFSLYENKRYKTQLTFKEPGSYTIPGIWLNEEYQTFGDINVNVKWFWSNPLDLLVRYWILISFVLGVLALAMRTKFIRALISQFILFGKRNLFSTQKRRMWIYKYYRYKYYLIKYLQK